MNRVFFGILAFIIGCLMLGKDAYARGPLSQSLNLKSLDAESRILLPELDLETMRSKAFGGFEKALKFAQINDYSIDPRTSGKWSHIEDKGEQMSVWRLLIESPNAYSINLGFSRYQMPEKGKLYLYTPGYENLVGPFTEKDNEEHGQLWTPIVAGKKLIIEVNLPTASVEALMLVLSKINQAYLDVTNFTEEFKTLKSGACNFDVVCPQGNEWRDQIRSVAAYSTGGFIFCTGVAINNAANDGRPFFLTANHCGVDGSNAPSVVAYWNFQNSICRTPGGGASGGLGDGVLSQFNTGAFLRAAYSPSDMTLLEFDDPVLNSANVFFSGWNRANTSFSSAVGIHHPRGGEKRISFENNPVAITAYLEPPGSGSTHIRVFDWDLGTTEPGSSGSPLYDSEKRIIGQLHGGGAACGNDLPDWYGRVSVSWQGGGSNGSRLKNWLDPNNSGVSAINGVNAMSTVRPLVPLSGILILMDDG